MKLPDNIPPEMRLLLDCVRYALATLGSDGSPESSFRESDEVVAARIRAVLGFSHQASSFTEASEDKSSMNHAPYAGEAGVDLDALIALANSQRVIPLLYKAFGIIVGRPRTTDHGPRTSVRTTSEHPSSVACRPSSEDALHALARLKRLFLINAARNIRMTEELCRILALFERAGIRAIPVKGPVLAVQAYGGLSMRQFDDLDLLLRPEDMIPAGCILKGEGYRPGLELNHGQERAYARSGQDRPFRHSERGIGLDLNSRIISHVLPQFGTVDELIARCERQTVEGHEVTGLGAEDVFLTLCIHGVHHAWERLSWSADIAALMSSGNAPDLGRVREKAREAGLERTVASALQSVNHLPGIPLLSDDPLLTLSVPSCPFLTHSSSSFLWPFQFKLLERRGDRLRFIIRQLFVPSIVEWRALRLPGCLAWLYCLFRPVRLLFAFFRGTGE